MEHGVVDRLLPTPLTMWYFGTLQFAQMRAQRMKANDMVDSGPGLRSEQPMAAQDENDASLSAMSLEEVT